MIFHRNVRENNKLTIYTDINMTSPISFVSNLTDLLTNTVVKQVDAQIKMLAKKIVDGKLQTEADILKVWNTINADFKPKATKADKDAPQCEHIFEAKDGKPRCSGKVSVQSESKKFCSKHYRSHEQKAKPKEEKKQCIYDKSGKDKKTRCKNGVCKTSQDYCFTHQKKVEEEKAEVVEEEPNVEEVVEAEPKVEEVIEEPKALEEEPLETGDEKPEPQKKPVKKC
jgi:hypothetical protein